MKRWSLPIAQLIVGAVMLLAAIINVSLAVDPTIISILALGDGSGLKSPYFWVVAAAAFSAAAAFIYVVSTVLLLRRTINSAGTRLSIAGTICCWAYIGAHLIMLWRLNGGGLKDYFSF